ncbi:MAG: CDP-glycerol glycerophosphotransferase family protein, partial [Candidatus Ornithomonoglobus sp.]
MIRDIMYIPYLRCPIERKVVGSAFEGRKYGDNTQYIFEKLHELDDTVELVWVQDSNYEFEVPDYVRIVKNVPAWQKLKEYATAMVWVN